MYLSRLLLDPRHAAARRDLADCRQLHRTILAGFPRRSGTTDGAREEFGVLYRVEPGRQGYGGTPVLVQSRVAPDWSHLVPGYLFDTGTAADNPAGKSLDGMYAALRPGMPLRFRLRANATKRLHGRVGQARGLATGRRVELVGNEAQLAWLRRKGEFGGFRLAPVPATDHVAQVIARSEPKVSSHVGNRSFGMHDLTFGSVLFDGLLIVTDVQQFRQTLEQGVGPGKAFGFGLLSIAPSGRSA